MKRILHFVLMLLVVVSTIGSAEAKSTKKKKTTPAAVDQTSAAAEAHPATQFDRERKQSDSSSGDVVPKPQPIPFGPPVELQLKRADSRRFDLRSLPRTPPVDVEQERAELPEPNFHPVTVQGSGLPEPSTPIGPPTPQAPAPPPINVFEGLDRFNWGAGSPPDTNGDVGPNNYIETVNTSIGVYRKSDGFQQAAFTFNTFMSQGHFGNLCDTNNFGDPVVLYDTFEDRWMISDFAFLTDISGNVLAPSFQCFAVSMTGDPVAGGWNFYSIQISDALNDYPKFGVWPDGFYMSANMFSFGAGSSFKTARAWAFNKAQMYAGSPTVKVVTFDIAGGDFAVMPSNARLQTGTPPPGRPNLFISTEEFLNALTVYKFHVDWNSISQSTFTGPDTPLAATSWPNASVGNAGQPGTAMLLDVLQIRAMVQNQYTNFGGTESLWIPHTVRRGAGVNGTAAPRWYQANVTGGTVAANLVQGTTWDPDGASITNRFMPSLALDRAGNMAMGYSVSSAVNEPLSTTPPTNCTTCVDTFPSIRYAGRLAADPINTFSQTEQIFFTGTASQTGINRWGDYSAMTLDPDGCRFWYTNEYANPADQTFNHRWLTKFGSIQAFPGCTPIGAGGTVSGTVTAAAGGAPISGATVQLGVGRSTTTDGSGNYSFTGIPAGTYPSMTASKSGFVPGSASSIVVTDGGTTTQNFSLTAAPASACLTDTTQSDFQAGVFTSTLDINTSPGDVTLSNAPVIDQQNTAGTNTGTGFGTPNWTGQTFIPAVTGLLARVDFPLFCNGCTGTTPNLTLSVRATSAGLPTGADLASVTIPGFSNGSATTNLTAIFGSPATLTSGTQYALILRPAANPSVGGYFWIRSSPSTYANGSRVTSADSGATWTADTTRDFNFKAYMQVGYNAAGNLVSSPKDSNPAGGLTPIWTTLSWTATTPANTSLQFQVAGSNNVNGPFNFVGPDGTAGTFFTTSGASLSQFYNLRYLEYKAYLATTDSSQTPTLSDVTLCFTNLDCSVLPPVIPTPAQVCSNSIGNTANGPPGETSYAWGITNGTITGGGSTQTVTYTAGASGTVGLILNIVEPAGCRKTLSANVTINPLPPTPTITPSGSTTVTYPNTVTLNSSSATGNQWYLAGNPIGGATNQAYIASASGNYTVVVTDVNNCVSATSSITTVTVNPATPVVTATGGTFSYDGTPKAGSGTATGGAGESLTVTLTYNGTGSTTYGPTATAPTLPGTYTVTAHTPGDANNNPGDSTPAALTINKANPIVTATGGTFTYNGNPQAASGSATGGAGEVLTFTLSYSGTGATTYGPSATAPSLAGTYTVTAHTPGDANNNAGDSSPTALTINKFNTAMSALGGTVTYTGTPHAGSGQALGGAGESLPVTLSYQGISGTVYGPSATAPTNVGNYLVTAHTVGDANNNAEDSAPVALQINKATATISVTGYCVSFDGSAHTAAASATGVLSEALTGLVVTATTHTAAGTYASDAWSFTNANYSDASGTVNDSIVNATITAPAVALTGATGLVASVASAGGGATYAWGITGGTITGGAGTNSITFTAGAVGTLTLNVTVTTSVGCGISKSANVAVSSMNVTSVVPAAGRITGGSPVTINGSGFQSGATVTFGGLPATSVVFVSSVKLTAKTPAHVAGQVNVTVTNPDTTASTLTNGFRYVAQQFDVNGDNTIDPSDIFFLVDYLFDHGPAPQGAAGMLSGDANGDGVVDPADIFYIINYLFMGGPVPYSTPVTPVVTNALEQPFRGALSLGEPATRGGRTYVPVILTMAPGSPTPQAIALKLLFDAAPSATIHRAGAAATATTSFEISRPSGKELSYLVAFDQRSGGLSLGRDGSRSAVIAEVEMAATESLNVEFDPAVTLLSDASGTHTANVADGTLQVTGIESAQRPGTKRSGINQ
jgi:Carboxypeptidase regulatory-like domain/IPT/TIG domain/Dockerin type I domain